MMNNLQPWNWYTRLKVNKNNNGTILVSTCQFLFCCFFFKREIEDSCEWIKYKCVPCVKRQIIAEFVSKLICAPKEPFDRAVT